MRTKSKTWVNERENLIALAVHNIYTRQTRAHHEDTIVSVQAFLGRKHFISQAEDITRQIPYSGSTHCVKGDLVQSLKQEIKAREFFRGLEVSNLFRAQFSEYYLLVNENRFHAH